MLSAYKTFWRQFFDFKNPSSRSDYWWVFLINLIIYILLMTIFLFSSGLSVALTADVDHFSAITWIALALLFLWGLASIIPMSALAMRRIRDTGLSPFLWLVFPISLILGEFTQILAMIISVILAIIYLVFTLLPSKNSKIAPYSQIRGSLIATIGLLVLVIFSVGHLPAKAEQIAQSQMTTKITVKTTMREELKFPTNLSAAGKQSLIEIYTTPRGNEEGWKLSSDQSYVYRDVTPENEPIIIDGKTHTTNDDGIVDTKANATESKMSMSTPNAEVMSFSVVPSLTTKKATSENFTLLAGIKYNNGALVTCNRFNGFLGNQLYYDKFKQPVEALKNFFASDCDFAIAKSNSCFADYGAVKNRYCALGSGVPSYKNGQCSKFIHHSTRFHKHTSYYK
ncbi:Hypothetical protein NCDO2118_0257 [Lactococcus lactis subsp. lactis NCDO 2118]|uniref:DUF805 domain-containing protein n=1 Tax=Lactococcus lactis subsp. lactis NCDO 2118 TaxID=1117941 RepID=A0ABC8A3I6_LACLL|nr:DUF805 domain-containing protein [Lactococcus lactis]ADA64040.1 Hypothetical protein LLKF_0258 [Lactococcus lactis subsp. lactis KF147]AII11756.1 Hypothetical protein NCDO2118_0257 [Lactococcus lactis subsp. lactis NCDO 2118]